MSRTAAPLRSAASPLLTDPQKAGRLRVVGASSSLDTGNVDFFDEG